MRSPIILTALLMLLASLAPGCKYQRPSAPDAAEVPQPSDQGLAIATDESPPVAKPPQADPDSETAHTGEQAPQTQKPGAIAAPADVAAPPPDAARTPTGLASKVLQPGTGQQRPGPNDQVTVHYTGWTTDGEMFDSSVLRGEPARFPLGGVIPGWTEGLQLMVVGEKRRLWIPETLAYAGKPNRPQGMLVFDVELIDILHAPQTPPDVAAIPADAQTQPSGLATRVLTPGTGTEHPAVGDVVTVHYSGWTTNGQMFDSSVLRGEAVTIGVDQVIPGWTEALQLMVVGEKRRLWIPEALAYQGRPGAPQGMLVFDVELVSFTPMPKAPPHVDAPPPEAETTASGLASLVLTQGSGSRHPSADSVVVVHYSGWTTDGNLFDTSLKRGKPITFPLDSVIAGWTEGVQLMVEGEKRRFWIPEALAYQGRPGAPQGMLVFDVELLQIIDPAPAADAAPSVW